MVCALLTAVSDAPFSAVSAVLGTLTFIALMHVQFIRPAVRRRKLTKPVKAWFLIPAQHRHPLNYAVSDVEDHAVSELVLPPNSECDIQICMTPRLSFRNSELSFGCDWLGDTDLVKPFATEFFLPFVARGSLRSGSPDTDPTHYVDFNKHYHIRRDVLYVMGQDVLFGFKIRTKDVGIYKVQISFKAEEVQGTAELSLRVEGFPPKTQMRCTCHGHFIGVPRL